MSIWKRPDTIDSIDSFDDLSIDELWKLVEWARENVNAYFELGELAQREISRRYEEEKVKKDGKSDDKTEQKGT